MAYLLKTEKKTFLISSVGYMFCFSSAEEEDVCHTFLGSVVWNITAA